jgi:hypothetical protein
MQLDAMYAALERAAGVPLIPDALPTLEAVLAGTIPGRGVYFFFEDGELRRDASSLRVTRVGTHALKLNASSTLRGRLRAHAGTRALSGNHRSSIFRLHMGSALLTRASVEHASWGLPRSAVDVAMRRAERDLERVVSTRMRATRVVVLEIPDVPSPYSDRAYVERNAIGLLANEGLLDPPSADWLGRHSARSEIRDSGLWNLEHLRYRTHPEFIDVLNAIASNDPPRDGLSLAPEGWWRPLR